MKLACSIGITIVWLYALVVLAFASYMLGNGIHDLTALTSIR
jgi:hypothetical protein